MSDDEELRNIELSIQEERQSYFRHRDHLRLLIEEARGPESGLEALMALADEFGTDDAMMRFASEPQRFGFDRDTPLREETVRDRFADVLTEVTDANHELGWLIGVRETILCERDPSRQRIYNVDGREAVLDIPAQKVRYLDAPADEETLTITAVEPTVERTPELEEKLLRERRRERERNR